MRRSGTLRSIPRHQLGVAVLLGCLAVAAAPGAALGARRVLVVSSSPDDARIETVRAAIAYWCDLFAELGLAPPLVEAGVVTAPPGARALENFAWQISRAAGRLPDGAAGPPPPPELLALDGDIVVLLSSQPLLPFARALGPASVRYLVAVAATRDRSQSEGTTRNVVAHELGHVLGLRHGDDPTALMCEPCPLAGVGGSAAFRPLGDVDRTRLLELYGPPAGAAEPGEPRPP